MIIAVAVGAALVVPVAADRVTAEVIEGRIAERLRCVAGTSNGPVTAAVGGFPVLAQVASGRLEDVRVSASGLRLGAATLSRVAAEARGVELPGSGGIEIDAVRVDATVDYAVVAQRLSPAAGSGGSGSASGSGSGLSISRVSGDDAGRLVLETVVSRRGLSMPASIHAELAVDGDRLTVRPVEVELAAMGLRVPASRLPGAAGQARTVALPKLPGGLTYRAVSATPDGLRVIADGTDLKPAPRSSSIASEGKNCDDD